MAQPLKELSNLGQSIWYDNIQRSMFASGQFNELIAAGILGMTSNPSIFDKAISGSSDYDDAIKDLHAKGRDLDSIYEGLVLEDIASAADLLRAIYDRSEGLDGYVSLEVRPTLARDTENTILEALRLFETLDRPNIMIKVPATSEGIPAIRQLTAEGVNINVTLIFSLDQYEMVAEAYLAGLEERLASGQDISRISSVASFFVSRVDTAVDRQLEDIGNKALQGKIGIANSKAAYRRFQHIFAGQRWESLESAGARVQRPLWASTSTKNPAYPDTLYVDNLIGPNTVNTVPPAALEAFIDHGQVQLSLESDMDLALEQLHELRSLGIDLDQITQTLQEDGVAAFEKSFLALMDNLSQKVDRLQNGKPGFQSQLGDYEDAVYGAMQEIAQNDIIDRIYARDYTLWKQEPEEISNRLGWLDIAERMKGSLADLHEFVTETRQAGIEKALLLGMGGSSLAPEVFRETFAVADGFLDLAVLDSTDPDAIAAQAAALDLEKTLFIVSTKSGGTVETISFFKYFYNQVADVIEDQEPGSHFIAITDAGSQLDKIAEKYNFRRIFHNDPNIGGRYSALSYFGLVPAALLGVDLEKLLDLVASADKNEAARLGVIMGELARAGRDKLTLYTSPAIASFGNWVEQLIAESTGKDGRGILPVVGEPVNPAHSYGNDRIFVYLKVQDDTHFDQHVADLEATGQPVVRMQMDTIYDLGAQMFTWELATAIAGTRLQINPFDQPNVEAAKVLARQMVSAYQDQGELPGQKASIEIDDLSIYPDQNQITVGAVSVKQIIKRFLGEAEPGAYIALQAYIQPTPQAEQHLQALRSQLQTETGLATTLGYGPRFLHSTGQLHKGDAGKGLFIQFTSDPEAHIPIPDQPGTEQSGIDFGVLKQAQSMGDRQALLDSDRRVLSIHLGQDTEASLESLVWNES